MTPRVLRHLPWAVIIPLVWPGSVWAGMPTPVLTDWAATRLTTLSFFGLVFVVSALVARGLWNLLAGDFSQLPRLGYRQALAGVGLVGSLLAIVLTMIAGARELLTPRAWQREGQLYKVTADAADTPEAHPDPTRLVERQGHLLQLRLALWDFAARHEGRFPDNEAQDDIDPELWQPPGPVGARYLYAPGLHVGDPKRVLVHEPDIFDGRRLVLYTNGESRLLPNEQLRGQLRSGIQP